jgi:hypothetical protein
VLYTFGSARGSCALISVRQKIRQRLCKDGIRG